MVFLKLITLPLLSVSLPSSRICRSTLKTSGWAFSTSSNRTTEQGLRRTFSVSCPPLLSSQPIQPGGAPISLETECFSINSDMSSLIINFSSPNMVSASAFARSVLPTPVGPTNIKEPMGLSGSLSPARARRIALETAETASSCPIMRLWRFSSKCRSFSLSCSVSLITGTPVQPLTISAISLPPILGAVVCFSPFHSEVSFLIFS